MMELRLCLTIAPDEDKEVDYEILTRSIPIIDWKTEIFYGTKPQFDESKRSEEINMNVVTRSNGQKRSFSTLIRVLLVFDREDLDAIYKLVMDIYQDKIPEVLIKVLWGFLGRFDSSCSIQVNKMSFRTTAMNGTNLKNKTDGSKMGFECWLPPHNQMVHPNSPCLTGIELASPQANGLKVKGLFKSSLVYNLPKIVGFSITLLS
ncbi:hypothetical protein Tco_0635310 [Tanacetum coccineum]